MIPELRQDLFEHLAACRKLQSLDISGEHDQTKTVKPLVGIAPKSEVQPLVIAPEYFLLAENSLNPGNQFDGVNDIGWDAHLIDIEDFSSAYDMIYFSKILPGLQALRRYRFSKSLRLQCVLYATAI